MRSHSTALVVATAVVLALVIVVVSDLGQAADDPAGDGPATETTDHRAAHSHGHVDTVDVAEATRNVAPLERAQAANPDNVRVMLNLGDAYVAARRYDDAEAIYRRALAASPGHPNAAVGLAAVWHARGDDDRAARILERVLRTLPHHQRAQYDLALVLFSRQEVAASREAWLKAAQIDPGSDLGRRAQAFVGLLAGGGATP